jgi:hypothetical protein
MSAKWEALIANDPERDYRLYIELLEGEAWRGRIERDDLGQLRLTFYGPATGVPWDWLSGLVERFKADGL